MALINDDMIRSCICVVDILLVVSPPAISTIGFVYWRLMKSSDVAPCPDAEKAYLNLSIYSTPPTPLKVCWLKDLVYPSRALYV